MVFENNFKEKKNRYQNVCKINFIELFGYQIKEKQLSFHDDSHTTDITF